MSRPKVKQTVILGTMIAVGLTIALPRPAQAAEAACAATNSSTTVSCAGGVKVYRGQPHAAARISPAQAEAISVRRAQVATAQRAQQAQAERNALERERLQVQRAQLAQQAQASADKQRLARTHGGGLNGSGPYGYRGPGFYPTRRGIGFAHYSRNGIVIIPARPASTPAATSVPTFGTTISVTTGQ